MTEISFEQEIKNFLREKKLFFLDNSTSTTMPDFILGNNEKPFYLDVKEKMKKYNPVNWGIKEEEEQDYFIIDELGIRKIMLHCPLGGILVRNNILKDYTFYSALDFICMPKTRVNRKLNENNLPNLKGKWLIKFSYGYTSFSLSIVMAKILTYIKNYEKEFSVSPCHGNYKGEEIKGGGVLRSAEYKSYDYSHTR